MTQREQWELGFVGVAALAILYMLFGRGTPQAVLQASTAATPTPLPNVVISPGRDAGSEYYLYNQPQVKAQSFDPQAGYIASSTNPASTAPTCGCTGAGVMFAGQQDLWDYFNKTLKGVADRYANNVLSALPTYFTQYFNAAGGTALSSLAAHQFG